MGEYRFLEHATDAIVEVRAEGIADAFLSAAEATIDLTLERDSVRCVDAVTFDACGDDIYYLLFSWLEEIIFVMITRGFAIGRVEIDSASSSFGIGAAGGQQQPRQQQQHIRARAYGEPIDLARHGFKVEAKAPTFHDMVISEGRDGTITMRFLLDL